MKLTIPVFAFPAEAGTHLLTPEGWKAELALRGWLVTYQIKCELNPDMVAHLGTNRVRRRLTLLIEANVLTTMPDHHHDGSRTSAAMSSTGLDQRQQSFFVYISLFCGAGAVLPDCHVLQN